MDAEDLLAALVVARVAIQRDISLEDAVEFIGEKSTERFRPRRKENYVAPTVRPLRKTSFELQPLISKIKVVCGFAPSEKTVQALIRSKRAIELADWSTNYYQSRSLACQIEECLLLALSGAFTLSTYGSKTQDILLDILCILFSRMEKNSQKLTANLIGILAQLVFLYLFPGGCDDMHYTLFLSVSGIKAPLRPMAQFVTKRVHLILVEEVIRFHVEMLNAYCATHDKKLGKQIKPLVMACLLVYGENELLDFANALPW